MIACPIGGRVRTQIGGYTVNVSLVGTGQDGVYGVQCRRYILHDRAPSSQELGGAGIIKIAAARAKFAYNSNRSANDYFSRWETAGGKLSRRGS